MKRITVIITEDDDGHAELIREGLENSGVTNPIIRFSNGEELWAYLNGESRSVPGRKPNEAFLLLLDINMPRMDGLDVLKRIKQSPDLRSFPVIMLTTTDDPREIQKCYELGCNAYVTKPVDFSQFAETLRRLGLFLQIVQA
ncbi:response regulator [Treponema zuelzerae]|uniref:Response regulator n=1 Tax=Teretinema zuelzerae TaxID=156 RepID=A0AAE3JIB0_9SPIR|nr:response regulator [Teretinema zuelzerae]MBN2811479.1 response regulator [Spirochaetales bacterium]MCD1654942.1 response regulator [Teretinema zuelzerae]HPO01907.1 response regulator [Treponemataceae bacterium]